MRAFGLSLDFDGLDPPGAWERHAGGDSPLRVRLETRAQIAASWSGRKEVGWEATIDGARFVVERGVAGDHRFVHGADPAAGEGASTLAIHHLDAEAGLLRCAPADADGPLWWRVVLDSVLFTVALLRGYEALHAGAVASRGAAVAITAASGGGKSTLLAELVRRDLDLIADDVLVLEQSDERGLIAHPAPPLMTVPAAVRGLGADTPERPICAIGGEHWIAVRVRPEPLALRALVVLDRRAGSGVSIDEIREPLATLMGSCLRFPRSAARERSRFELASALSAQARLLRLEADVDTPPTILADTLLETLCQEARMS
ncbi:MAG TPA: hypothetical protein VL979_13805 [Solirubrobacteraceae bacterium]|nr:hypothetical protein [Solirubrobacteraceae bacterium]